MKRLAFLLALICCAMPSGPAAAQPGDFAPFWKEFAAAAKNNDKARIASLTKFPYEYRLKKLGPGQFDTIWKTFFPPSMLACLARAKPVKDYQAESYSVFCKKIIYMFSPEPEGWRFVATGVDN
ncbi:MAG: hypothetical protein FJX62_20925 [Alphaproteobacteria bacterium]|nr:hypothetical protein [Alphaproteobacteria bacterium]